MVAVLIQAAPLAGPVLLSTDAYTYWAYGRVAAVHGENPYRTAPEAFPEDPAYERMGADWRDTTSVYGPGFTLGSEAVALAAGDSHAGASWAFRGIAAASMVALTCSPRSSPAAAPSLRRSSAGTRSWPFTLRAAGTTTRS